MEFFLNTNTKSIALACSYLCPHHRWFRILLKSEIRHSHSNEEIKSDGDCEN